MRNQPKYSFFKNPKYALEGLKEVFLNETSFRIEIFLFLVFSILIQLLALDFISMSILQISLFLTLLVEVINSSIERVVDLVTNDYHIMAKKAKDAGAAAVFISIIITILIWISVLVNAYYL